MNLLLASERQVRRQTQAVADVSLDFDSLFSSTPALSAGPHLLDKLRFGGLSLRATPGAQLKYSAACSNS